MATMGDIVREMGRKGVPIMEIVETSGLIAEYRRFHPEKDIVDPVTGRVTMKGRDEEWIKNAARQKVQQTLEAADIPVTLSRQRLSEETRSEIRNHLRNGETIKDVSETFGVSYQAVYNIGRASGIVVASTRQSIDLDQLVMTD